MTTALTDVNHDAPPLLAVDSSKYAFFFDVDGTLAAIQPEPDAVTIPLDVRHNLQKLADHCEGALALVSGRPISQLDTLAAPLVLPLAGVHGAELRDAANNLHRVELPADVAEPLRQMLEDGMKTLPGTLLEAKGMAFALHYRQAPQFEKDVLALAESAVAQFAALTLQPGKCVVEIKPHGTDKGAAINTFMQHAPFHGRIPVFVGDDLTDEKGFQTVNALQGISVKVGEGSTNAAFRLAEVTDVYDWIAQLLLQLQQDKIGKEFTL